MMHILGGTVEEFFGIQLLCRLVVVLSTFNVRKIENTYHCTGGVKEELWLWIIQQVLRLLELLLLVVQVEHFPLERHSLAQQVVHYQLEEHLQDPHSHLLVPERRLYSFEYYELKNSAEEAY